MFTNQNLLITNTYPAFLQSLKVHEGGDTISSKFDKIKRTNLNKTDMTNFNSLLNEVVKEVYDQKKINSVHLFEDGPAMLIGQYNKQFDLLLLLTSKYLILLSLELEKHHHKGLNTIPIDGARYHIHVREVLLNKEKYKVTNTYNSFISFSEINKYPRLHIGINEDFFRKFLKSIQIQKIVDKEVADRCVPESYLDNEGNIYYTGCHYKYVVADDLIIIVEYIEEE